VKKKSIDTVFMERRQRNITIYRIHVVLAPIVDMCI